MSEWKEYKLGEVASFVKDKVSVQDIAIEDYISTENMVVDKGGVVKVTNKPTEGSVTKYYPDTVLVSNIRPYFKKIWYADRIGGCSNDVLCFQKNNTIIESKYLYYLLSQDTFFDYVMIGSKGCKMPRGDKLHIMNWNVVLPPLDEQKRIVGVLSSLDDKIDLLNRENATLEALAETLFRHYFIENPNPDWKEGKLGDMIDAKSGYAFKGSSFVENGLYKLVTIKAVQDGFLILENADGISNVPANVKHYCFLSIGDIILSLTGNVGRCCLVDSERLLLNQRVALLCAKNNNDWAFVYTLFRMESMKSTLEIMAKGTAQLNLSPVELSNMPFVIPSQEILKAFSNEATPLLKKVLFNKRQIKLLKEQRDTLLPHLMSGEVNVDK